MLKISEQKNPNFLELSHFFEVCFDAYDERDVKTFTDSEKQPLSDWFDFDAFEKNFQEGILIEGRENNLLVGAIFIAKQHPISWPDGHKVEIFIICVDPANRSQHIGKKLLEEASVVAKKMGGKSLIANAFGEVYSVHQFYEKNGFKRIGTLKNYYANGDAVFFKKEL